ncbi:MAG: hypothetical protein SH868_06330 [Bythopirellula sp.]|nr:hypothetical protein [Bythopirellula sp.]
MSFELTPDQRQAVLANAGLPLHIHDSESKKVFLLIEQGSEPLLDDEYIGEGLRVAREQIARGELASRGIEEVIAEARRRS